ncbi:MAG: hypothetical protein P8H03_09855, partial [Emcibacteraceae bacterium]|nr:hypothetical protein [Emcibacteraceae bacterium]
MIRIFFISLIAMLFLQCSVSAQDTENTLFIEQAVKLAQENDPWLTGNRHMQDAAKSKSVAAGSLPDPQISL